MCAVPEVGLSQGAFVSGSKSTTLQAVMSGNDTITYQYMWRLHDLLTR